MTFVSCALLVSGSTAARRIRPSSRTRPSCRSKIAGNRPSTFVVPASWPLATSVTDAVTRIASPERWKPPVTSHRAPSSRPARRNNGSPRSVVSLLERFQTLRQALSRHDGHAFELPDVSRQRFADPGAKPVVFRIARDVGEGPDEDAVTGRSRVGAGAGLARLDGDERVADVDNAGHSSIPVAGQHSSHQSFERTEPGIVISASKRRNLVAKNGFEHLRGVAAGERRRAVEQLVEHDAEGEDVGASIDFAARRLLGGRVGECADKAGQAIPQLGRSRLVAGRQRVTRTPLRDAKVEHLDAPARR